MGAIGAAAVATEVAGNCFQSGRTRGIAGSTAESRRPPLGHGVELRPHVRVKQCKDGCGRSLLHIQALLHGNEGECISRARNRLWQVRGDRRDVHSVVFGAVGPKREWQLRERPARPLRSILAGCGRHERKLRTQLNRPVSSGPPPRTPACGAQLVAARAATSSRGWRRRCPGTGGRTWFPVRPGGGRGRCG